jgi:hypothetical protein
MDLRNTDDDMDITNGELSFVDGAEAVAQDVAMAWRTWLGESVYDVTVGVPYTQVIFVGKNPNLDAVRFILERIALARPGVTGVELTPVLDNETRELTATGTLHALDEEIDFSEVISGGP